MECEVDDQRKELKEQKRDLDLLESDLNRIHRKILIENQTTYSIIMDSISDFEKDFFRTVNEDKQTKTFLQVQLNTLHKDKRLIEAKVRNLDGRAQWC